jgi:hypothetical protein
MKNGQPSFKIYYADGTFGNFIKLAQPAPGQEYLEAISGMKYGRKDILRHTMKILLMSKVRYADAPATMAKIFCAAESVLVNFYRDLSKGNSILVQDVDNDECVLYMTMEPPSPTSYVVRITRMVEDIIYDLQLEEHEMITGGAVDFKGVIENLKFFELEGAQNEDYISASRFRDLVAHLNKKIKKGSRKARKG